MLVHLPLPKKFIKHFVNSTKNIYIWCSFFRYCRNASHPSFNIIISHIKISRIPRVCNSPWGLGKVQKHVDFFLGSFPTIRIIFRINPLIHPNEIIIFLIILLCHLDCTVRKNWDTNLTEFVDSSMVWRISNFFDWWQRNQCGICLLN